MLLYTPMPLELVLEGLEKKRSYQEINIGGVITMVERITEFESRIIRIISTDPNDFLNIGLQPGTIIPLGPGNLS